MYISESEGSNFWLSVLTDLQNRGIKDVLIACIDNLKGFAEAIVSIFPQTEVQSCIVHQIRNSLKYVASKNQKEFMADLKLVYQADTKEYAEEKLDALEDKWGKKYPVVIASGKTIGISSLLISSTLNQSASLFTLQIPSRVFTGRSARSPKIKQHFLLTCRCSN